MASYFSAIFRVQLLAALALITSIEALNCYESVEICDNETCSGKGAAASFSRTFNTSECTPRVEGLTAALKLGPEFAAFLKKFEFAQANITIPGDEMNVDDYAIREKMRSSPEYSKGIYVPAGFRVPKKAKIIRTEYGIESYQKGLYVRSPYIYKGTQQSPLCSRTMVTLTVKLPTKTIQKTAVVRGCTIGYVGCNDIVHKFESASGNIEVRVKNCHYEGNNSNSGGTRIVVNNLLALGPFFVIGMTGFLARHTQLHR